MFKIALEPEIRLIHITLAGFWNLSTMDRFEDAMTQSIDRLRRAAEGFDQLIDGTSYPVQSQAVIDGHKACAAKWLDMGLRRTAMLVANSGLAKMQAGRISENAHRVFVSEQEARAWLGQPEQEA